MENTSKSVDLDLINNILREPQRARLSIILNELGVGLAGRGADLDAVIRRANPALRELDDVLRLLARQNEQLEQLAVDSDTIMAPLARERRHVSSAIENMSEVAAATAERRADLEANVARLPRFLRELRPTMTRLGALADEMSPVVSDLGDVAPDINRFLLELGPFSEAGIPALDSLGEAAQVGQPAVRGVAAGGARRANARERVAARRPPARRGARVLPGQRRHREPDGVDLLPGHGGQRVRRLRALPARGPDRQPVLDLRGRADGGLLGELPPHGVEHRRRGGQRRGSRATRCWRGPRACCRGSTPARRRRCAARPRRRRPRSDPLRRSRAARPDAAPDVPLLDYLFGAEGG